MPVFVQQASKLVVDKETVLKYVLDFGAVSCRHAEVAMEMQKNSMDWRSYIDRLDS